MIFKYFLDYFPEITERETRRIKLRNDPKIPDGEYAFIESFCDDKGCDCRRAYFDVIQVDPDYKSIHAATISYGWEKLDFYRSWGAYLPLNIIVDMKGPILEPSQKQSQYAEFFLELFKSKLLIDPEYIDRIKRHYVLFKKHLNSKANKTKGRK